MVSLVRSLTVALTAGLAAAVVMGGCTSESNPGASSSSPEAVSSPTADAPEADAETTTAANPATESRVVEGVVAEPGRDPMAMVFGLRQPSEEATGSEQLRLNYPAPDRAVVIHTQTNLPDDSVAGIRTRYEFQLADEAGANPPLWQLVQVTEQNKCRPGRGAQDWTGALCN